MALRTRKTDPKPAKHAGGSSASPNGKASADAASVLDQPPVRKDGRQLLGETIVQQKLVTQAALVEVLAEQPQSGRRLGAQLVQMGLLDEEQLAEVLAEQMGLPLADMREQTPEPEALALVSETVAR